MATATNGTTASHNGASNGTKTAPSFPPGIHVPSLTFFRDDKTQEMDWEVQEKHMTFLISSGLHGIVLAGSNGEAVALATAEKSKLIRRTREIAQSLGRGAITITAGCSGRCTRDVLEETREAKEAGADYALVLIPSYYHFAMTPAAITAFFTELADSSPIPILIYNYPGVAAGLDMNSDMIDSVAQHPNIVGIKLTCGGIAKAARVAATYSPEEFIALSGMSDWLLPAVAVGASGSITGVANICPKAVLQLFELSKAGKLHEAAALQREVALAEWGLIKGSINGTKWVVSKYLGYPESSSACRRPFPLYDDKSQQAWIYKRFERLYELEQGLSKH